MASSNSFLPPTASSMERWVCHQTAPQDRASRRITIFMRTGIFKTAWIKRNIAFRILCQSLMEDLRGYNHLLPGSQKRLPGMPVFFLHTGIGGDVQSGIELLRVDARAV